MRHYLVSIVAKLVCDMHQQKIDHFSASCHHSHIHLLSVYLAISGQKQNSHFEEKRGTRRRNGTNGSLNWDSNVHFWNTRYTTCIPFQAVQEFKLTHRGDTGMHPRGYHSLKMKLAGSRRDGVETYIASCMYTCMTLLYKSVLDKCKIKVLGAGGMAFM